VVVTGSSKGIGRKIAESFGLLGAKVVLNGRDENTLKDVASHFEKLGIECYPVVANVRNKEGVDTIANQIFSKFKKINIWINNAGGNFIKESEAVTPNAWNTLIELNLTSTFFGCQAAFNIMKNQENGGVILNISSISGQMANPGKVAYSAAKAGVDSLTKSLALEWASYNIRMNAVSPGQVLSEGFQDVFLKNEQMYQERINKIPLGRFGNVEDVASMCLYLCSPIADYMTGAIITIDGGRTIYN
jgi:NAD(P)-dependent dehydrogenase (short-subunit alcohol dehydrogenase family)